MSQILNTLIVDDHPIIIEAMTRALNVISKKSHDFEFDIKTANDCDSAALQISKARKYLPFDLVILDINMPPSQNRKLFSGEDIGVRLRRKFSDVKIIVMTSLDDNHVLCNIFKTINPDGFLIKSDIGYDDITKAILDVIEGSPYYSRTVTRLIRNHMSNQIVLDHTDRAILYHLSNGAKMKDLPEAINLSLAGIERRKRHLREVFDTPQKDDKILIERARAKGFV